MQHFVSFKLVFFKTFFYYENNFNIYEVLSFNDNNNDKDEKLLFLPDLIKVTVHVSY